MRKYRGLTKDGKWVYGWYCKASDRHLIVKDDAQLVNPCGGLVIDINPDYYIDRFTEVLPETVGQYIPSIGVYEDDYAAMECWNGGDGINEPSIRDNFEGVVVFDKKICRWGLQTKLCEENQIEVGLEDSQYTKIEILGNRHEHPALMEKGQ